MLGSGWARRVGTVATVGWLAGGVPTSAAEIRNWPCALPLAAGGQIPRIAWTTLQRDGQWL